MNKGIVYPELSYSIMGAGMDVHNELGPGWHEWDYHRAMISSLESRGHDVVSHERKKLRFCSRIIDVFELDLLVDNLVILELKHLKSDFHPNHSTQLINYLKIWRKRLGILINYGQEKLRCSRLPFDEKLCVKVLPDEVRGSLSGVCGHVHRGVQKVLSELGFGYSADTFKRLLLAVLDSDGVNVSIPVAAPGYRGENYEQRELDALLVEQSLLVSVAASSSASDFRRLLAYMKCIDVEEGVLVDMSDSKMTLRGLVL